MRISAAITLLLSTASFIIGFLCLFAGNKPGILSSPNYSIISVNTSQIGENIVRQVVNEFTGDPDRLLSLLNGLFANAIGSSLKGNTSGIASILEGSGITLPSGILPSGVTLPTRLPSTLPSISIPSQLASLTINIPTSIPSGLIPGLKGRGAIPESVAARGLAEREALLANIKSLKRRNIVDDILGTASRFTNLTDLPSAQALANRIIQDFANEIGIPDFYDFHVLKFCLGNFTPADKANATLPLSAIHRNVTQCPSYAGLDIETAVGNLLNQTGFASSAGITLDSINFPDNLEKYINLAKDLLKALTGLYAAVIGLSFFIMVLSASALVVGHGREVGLGTWIWIFSFLGWICAAVASVVVTVAGRLIGNEIKNLGADLGLGYQIGTGYLALTWTTFGALFIISFLGCFVCCAGRRRRRKARRSIVTKEMAEKDSA